MPRLFDWFDRQKGSEYSMGGRGSSYTRNGATGGVSGADIVSTTSLISMREDGKQTEVDQVLTVLRSVMDDFGVDLNDVQIAILKGAGMSAMAYYDSNNNLAINEAYFDSTKMDSAYDACVTSGFHPGRGDKSAMEAVAAHEAGQVDRRSRYQSRVGTLAT